MIVPTNAEVRFRGPGDTTDAEGRVTNTTPWSDPTRTHVAFLNVEEQDRLAARGERATMVALLDLDDLNVQEGGVSLDMDVTLDADTRLSPYLNGVWHVVAIRPTPVHIRVLGDRQER